MRFIKWLLAFSSLLGLLACGGGGDAGTSVFGGGGGGTGEAAAPTINLVLSSTSASTSSPIVAIATVLDAKGTPVSGALVTFTAGTAATLSQGNGATNSAGQVSVTVYPAIGVTSGADALTAAVSVSSLDLSSTKAFNVVASATQAGVTLSLSSDTVSTAPATTVTAVVRDVQGTPVPGQVVSFSTNSSLGALSAASALTDSSGAATVSLSAAPGVDAGAGYVTASSVIGGATHQTSRAYQVVPSGAAGSRLTVTISRTTVGIASPGTVSAVVTNGAGARQVDQLVRFSTADGFGAVSSATALTNSSGVASVTLTPALGVPPGTADYVVASTTVDGQTYRQQAPFQIEGTAATGSPTITVDLSSSTVTSIAPATVTAILRSGAETMSGQVLTFSTVSGQGALSATSALTDAEGRAQVLLSPKVGLTTGADYVTVSATVSGTSVTQQKGFQIGGNAVGIASMTSGLAAGTSLSAYGQTSVSVTLDNVAAGTPVTLAASSSCVDKGKATFLPATVTTTSGVATFMFKDIGCGATASSDNLKVTLSGTSVSQALVLPLSAPDASNIQFASATPETVYIKGSGFAESSTVVFKVTDLSGNVLPDQQVELCLTSLVGGLTLDGYSGIDCSVDGSTKKVLTRTSNSEGKVSAMVNSGTVPTPVRVRATLVGKPIATVSSNLAVAVGLPSQLNFSLSQGTKNIEGMNIDGTPNTYSIIASDRMGNPVPAGTTISFVTEGGQVEPSRQIVLTGGLARATANFVSSEPRPKDGRVTIVSYALGEESFLDLDGDNVYDDGEDFLDLGDIFVDRAYNGQWDSAEDQYVSLAIKENSTCRVPVSQALLGGLSEPWVPSRADTCNGTWGRAYVRRAIETVFSTSSARPLWHGMPGNSCVAAPVILQNGPVPFPTASSTPPTGSYYRVAGSLLHSVGSAGTVSFLVADGNSFSSAGAGSAEGRLNPMAAGTKVEVSTPTEDFTVSMVGGSPVPSSLEATSAAFSYKFKETVSSGIVILNFISPSGLVTTVSLTMHKVAVTCP